MVECWYVAEQTPYCCCRCSTSTISKVFVHMCVGECDQEGTLLEE